MSDKKPAASKNFNELVLELTQNLQSIEQLLKLVSWLKSGKGFPKPVESDEDLLEEYFVDFNSRVIASLYQQGLSIVKLKRFAIKIDSIEKSLLQQSERSFHWQLNEECLKKGCTVNECKINPEFVPDCIDHYADQYIADIVEVTAKHLHNLKSNIKSYFGSLEVNSLDISTANDHELEHYELDEGLREILHDPTLRDLFIQNEKILIQHKYLNENLHWTKLSKDLVSFILLCFRYNFVTPRTKGIAPKRLKTSFVKLLELRYVKKVGDQMKPSQILRNKITGVQFEVILGKPIQA